MIYYNEAIHRAMRIGIFNNESYYRLKNGFYYVRIQTTIGGNAEDRLRWFGRMPPDGL